MRGHNRKPPEGNAPPPDPRELALKQLRKKLADTELERDMVNRHLALDRGYRCCGICGPAPSTGTRPRVAKAIECPRLKFLAVGAELVRPRSPPPPMLNSGSETYGVPLIVRLQLRRLLLASVPSLILRGSLSGDSHAFNRIP